MNIIKNLFNSLPLLFIGGIMAYAAAPTGGYLPNTTLDPACAPNDIDCFVQIPVDRTSVWDNDDGSIADETGNIHYTEGNVGIGNLIPTRKLHVSGPAGTNGGVARFDIMGGVPGHPQLYLEPTANVNGATFNLEIRRAGLDANANMSLNGSGGNVGIGTFDPSEKLEISGAVLIGNTVSFCDTDSAGAIRYNGTVHQGCNGITWNDLY